MRTDFLSTVKRFSWQQWVVVILFVAVASFTTYRAVHTVRRLAYWQTHRDQPIRGWMTIGFVAHSYRVPHHVLTDALGIPDKPRDKRPLREIAKEQHRSIDEVRAILLDAINKSRQSGSAPAAFSHGGAP